MHMRNFSPKAILKLTSVLELLFPVCCQIRLHHPSDVWFHQDRAVAIGQYRVIARLFLRHSVFFLG